MKIAVMLPILIEHDWQRVMTLCCMESMAVTTKHPYDLVIVETGTKIFKGLPKRIGLGKGGGPNYDFNIGLNYCEKELGATHTVFTGNDIFTRPGWLEALIKCFEIDDCGLATVASGDLNGKLPIKAPADTIREGVYGPFCMFESHWRFDAETFPAVFGDTDLIMRIYESGKRSYRNYSVVIEHLNRQTLSSEEERADFLPTRERFQRRHGASPLLIYRMLSEGWII